MDVNGQIAFERDTFIPKEILKLKKKFNIKNVLETGSQYGASLEWFDNNFDLALGCEPFEEFYNIAKKRAKNVFNQDSIDFLTGIKGYKNTYINNTLIYIDSHWHGTPCPLKDELVLIAELNINPVIVIHDFKVPNKDFGFDAYDYELCIEEIESLLPAIYPNGYKYHYNTEADGANRGIVFIYPK